MVYTIITNGRSYDLPPKTIDMMDRLENVLRVDSLNLPIKEAYKQILDFLKYALGDSLKEILGSDDIRKVDVGEAEILVAKIRNAYKKPMDDFLNEQLEEAFRGIPEDKLRALAQAAELAKKE